MTLNAYSQATISAQPLKRDSRAFTRWFDLYFIEIQLDWPLASLPCFKILGLRKRPVNFSLIAPNLFISPPVILCSNMLCSCYRYTSKGECTMAVCNRFILWRYKFRGGKLWEDHIRNTLVLLTIFSSRWIVRNWHCQVVMGKYFLVFFFLSFSPHLCKRFKWWKYEIYFSKRKKENVENEWMEMKENGVDFNH